MKHIKAYLKLLGLKKKNILLILSVHHYVEYLDSLSYFALVKKLGPVAAKSFCCDGLIAPTPYLSMLTFEPRPPHPLCDLTQSNSSCPVN